MKEAFNFSLLLIAATACLFWLAEHEQKNLYQKLYQRCREEQPLNEWVACYPPCRSKQIHFHRLEPYDSTDNKDKRARENKH